MTYAIGNPVDRTKSKPTLICMSVDVMGILKDALENISVETGNGVSNHADSHVEWSVTIARVTTGGTEYLGAGVTVDIIYTAAIGCNIKIQVVSHLSQAVVISQFEFGAL